MELDILEGGHCTYKAGEGKFPLERKDRDEWK
jgi:hypothetical protein